MTNLLEQRHERPYLYMMLLICVSLCTYIRTVWCTNGLNSCLYFTIVIIIVYYKPLLYGISIYVVYASVLSSQTIVYSSQYFGLSKASYTYVAIYIAS